MPIDAVRSILTFLFIWIKEWVWVTRTKLVFFSLQICKKKHFLKLDYHQILLNCWYNICTHSIDSRIFYKSLDITKDIHYAFITFQYSFVIYFRYHCTDLWTTTWIIMQDSIVLHAFSQYRIISILTQSHITTFHMHIIRLPNTDTFVNTRI